MKPNFALSLSFEGVRLLHRSDDGWSEVGGVPADAADFGGDLAVLRMAALEMEPGGMRTKVLLIADWIKTFTIDDPRATDAEVRAAVGGATSGLLDDLAFDHSRGGGRTYVATVMREHLEEAEAFATDRGLQPVSFAAVLPEFSFRGEAFFGETRLARTLLAPGETVERDAEPTILTLRRERSEVVPPDRPVGESLLDAVPALSEPIGTEEAEPEAVFRHMPMPPEPAPAMPINLYEVGGQQDGSEPALVSDHRQATGPDLDESTPEPQPAEMPGPNAMLAVPPVVNAAPDAAMTVSDATETARNVDEAASVDGLQAEASAIEEAVAAPSIICLADGPATEVSEPPPPAPPATIGPEPIFASRARPTRGGMTPADEPGAPRPTERLVAARSMPPRQGSARRAPGRTEPAVRRAPAPMSPSGANWTLNSPGVAAGAASGLAESAPTLTGHVALAQPPVVGRHVPPSVGEAARPRAMPDVAMPDRDHGALQMPSPSVVAHEGARVAAVAVPRTEAARMTIFGARKRDDEERGRGRSRLLGLLLTVMLLVVMAAVGVWAAVSDEGLAGLWRSTDPVVEVAAVPLPEPIAAPPIPQEPTPSVEAAPEPTSVAPESAAAAAAAVAAALAEMTQIDATAPAPIPADIGAEPAEPAVPLPVLSDPADRVAVTPAEVDRVYAATGVWLRSPRLPIGPDAAVDLLPAVALDAAAASPAAEGPSTPVGLASASPDAGLIPQRNPPPSGTVYERDARGLILATSDGTLTPDGALVIAGRPDVIPPTRPGPTASAPMAPPDPATPLAAGDATESTESVAFAGPRPQARPAGAAPPAATGTPDAASDGPATAAALAALPQPPVVPGTLAFADATALAAAGPSTAGGVSLDGLRPSTRPGDAAGPAPVTELAALAPFAGPRPSPRPEGLAPEAASEPADPAIDEALAAALEQPAAPEAATPTTEAPAPQDLASTLATIMADAPDPLVGATAQAVATARRPDTRPRNFGGVVSGQLARLAGAAQPQAPAQGGGNLQPEEQAETASAAAAAPSGPTTASVAQAATSADVMALREMNLIGVYGQPGARRALVRMGNGRYLRVGVGDGLDGGQVTAIGDNALNFTRRGRTEQLVIPGR